MSDSLKKYSFSDLLKQGKIRIPKIQREYAQGRADEKVEEIRKVFVHTLLLVVKGKRPATELDFIYGSNRRGLLNLSTASSASQRCFSFTG